MKNRLSFKNSHPKIKKDAHEYDVSVNAEYDPNIDSDNQS